MKTEKKCPNCGAGKGLLEMVGDPKATVVLKGKKVCLKCSHQFTRFDVAPKKDPEDLPQPVKVYSIACPFCGSDHSVRYPVYREEDKAQVVDWNRLRCGNKDCRRTFDAPKECVAEEVGK